MGKQTTEANYQAFKQKTLEAFFKRKGISVENGIDTAFSIFEQQHPEAFEHGNTRPTPEPAPCKHCGTRGEHSCPDDLCKPNPTCPKCKATDALSRVLEEDLGPEWAEFQCEYCHEYLTDLDMEED